MTKINQDLREDLKDIESYILSILRSQPSNDEECQIHLFNSLNEIHKKSKNAFKKYVDNCNEQLKENCKNKNEKPKDSNL
jgi:hypothetical protein